MKKILLVTPIYPTNDKQYTITPVCHYFVKEWIKNGYDVKVVNLTALFPRLFHILAKPLLPLIKAKTGASIYINNPRHPNVYTIDGIEVLNIPFKQIVPHQIPSDSNCENATSLIVRYLNDLGFVPDIITGHMTSPTLGVIYHLKKRYHCSSCLVLHESCHKLERYKARMNDYMKSIDVWGFRSRAGQLEFMTKFPCIEKTFVCYSGIPSSYIETKNLRDFHNGVKHFAYLGKLYKLKKIDIILHSLNMLQDSELDLNIIGGGAEYDNLIRLSKELNLEKQVHFHGKQPRDKAQAILSNSDCFVMISKEAFGLVYLEAMAKGLITIGLKGSGIDGVIKDGINGFLCDGQSPEDLLNVFIRIKQLTPESLHMLSDNAISTVREFTDEKVAKKYINDIVALSR